MNAPEVASGLDRPPVVAAVVTSVRRLLVARRKDGQPPWTLIAGEIEPRESAAEAAVREVAEETGLLVRASEHEVGRRVHPKTGRMMIYIACRPVQDTDVFVADNEELEEVRWIGLTQADELLPDLFEPVRRHLIDELG